jgi:hypothetical protein
VKWVKEVKRDSWASFKPRRSTARVKQLLASPAACVAARAAAARRGGEGRGPARVGQAVGAGAGGHVARRGAARGQLGLGKWPAKAAGSRARAEQEGLKVDEGGLVWNFPKMQGLHCKDKTTLKP